jgi:hypothetical protein
MDTMAQELTVASIVDDASHRKEGEGEQEEDLRRMGEEGDGEEEGANVENRAEVDEPHNVTESGKEEERRESEAEGEEKEEEEEEEEEEGRRRSKVRRALDRSRFFHRRKSV